MTSNNFKNLIEKPTLLSVIKAFQHETLAKINCMKIGIIDEVFENNEVRCSITNKILMGSNKDGSAIWKEYPPIIAKIYYVGSGTNGIDYPVTVGMPCLLFFNDREFESYFLTGEVSPLSTTRMHSLSDCICLPLYQSLVDEMFNIKGLNINIAAQENISINAVSTITIQAETINLEASTINLNGTLMINGQNYNDHVHGNGNEGANTTGVVL